MARHHTGLSIESRKTPARSRSSTSTTAPRSTARTLSVLGRQAEQGRSRRIDSFRQICQEVIDSPTHRSMASGQMRSSRGLRAFRVTTSTARPRSSSRSWTKATDQEERHRARSRPEDRDHCLGGPLPWQLKVKDLRAAAAQLLHGQHVIGHAPKVRREACLGDASNRDTASRRTLRLLVLRVARAVRRGATPGASGRRRARRRAEQARRGHTRRASIARRFRRRFSQGLAFAASQRPQSSYR